MKKSIKALETARLRTAAVAQCPSCKLWAGDTAATVGIIPFPQMGCGHCHTKLGMNSLVLMCLLLRKDNTISGFSSAWMGRRHLLCSVNLSRDG